ncbi:S-protein homolog 1-like [Vigna radiata var. radiata]|uniref:S-protein homolog n=1 Tax=Vigna radiata var. radiata TaxID=3916 RepID=A0A1S3V032_VIGRR|nr:S-protein homolog 1-like [Vigna radiata var. radiata]
MEKKRNSVLLGKSGYNLLVLVLVLASANLSNASSVFPGLIKWHVYVRNELKNEESLLVHCQSKDDDLGSHKLFEGGNFTWSFRTDFLHSTLFWCHVKKDNNNNNNGCDRTASFDVFWYDEHLFQKCHWKNCLWRVRDDGIYLTALYETQTQQFYYHWGATRLP